MDTTNFIDLDSLSAPEQSQEANAEECNSLALKLREKSLYDEATNSAKEALALARAAKNIVQQGRALNILGQISLDKGSHETALEYFKQALVLFESIDDKSRIAIVIGNIGLVYYNTSDYSSALEYYHKAFAIHEEVGDKKSMEIHIGNIGNVYLIQSNYPKALEYYHKALALAEADDNVLGVATHTGNMGSVYLYLSDYPNALEYYKKALVINEKLGSIGGVAANISNIGGVYFYMKNYPKALEYYLEAVSIVDELGNKLDMAEFLSSIGNVYIALADYENALKYFYEALTMNTELGNKFGIASNISSLGNLYGEKKYQKYDGAKSEEYLLQSILLHGELGAKKNVLYSHQTLSGLYDQTGEIAKAYKHFKIYHDLEKEVQSEEAKKQAEQLDYERKTVEREKQAAIDRAKHEATEQLLHNVLPPSIATKMLSGTKLIAEKLNDVTVLFADIVNFTKLSQRISPEELVQGLDLIFSEFDLLVEQHGLEKIKTIGDAYMVVAGAPSPRSDHAQIMAVMAIDMQETIKKFSSVTTGAPIEIRIGIHTGEVVAGVIGKKKFQYDLWGDAVNTASRMESHGEAGKIHCTEEFKKKIEAIKSPQFYFLERDEMEIKGKGRMKTYFLE